MADTKSKVLIVGATGYLGPFLAKASVKLGHPTFVLVRSTNPSDPAKAELLKSFEELGAKVLKGDLTDHESLVAALRQVDVVISVVSGQAVLDQIKILDAAKETGTIKRFLPSEFGNDIDRLEIDFKAVEDVFGDKRKVRRAIEKSGIPYTYVIAGGFAGYFVATLAQENVRAPPRDKVFIWGGTATAILNSEEDIATFAIKAADDPRLENKYLHIRPKENFVSHNDLLALWEKKIGQTLEKKVVSKEELAKIIEEAPFPDSILHAIRYSFFVKGDHTNYELDASQDLEATELYPDVKYTTVSAYLDQFV